MGVNVAEIPVSWFQSKGAYDFRHFYSSSGRLYFSLDGYYFGRKNRIFYIDKKRIKQVRSKPSTHYFKGLHDSGGYLSAIDSYGEYYQWNDISENPEVSKSVPVDRSVPFNLVGFIEAGGYSWVLNTHNKIYQLEEGKTIRIYDVGDKNFGLIQVEKDPTEPFIFWIATYGGGLIKWNDQTHSVEKVLTKKEGLPDNTIAAMVPDNLGNIWMSTFNGVTKFNPKLETFSNFKSSDGLIQSEFDRYHGFKLPDGRIAFGAAGGYSVFDPSLFVEDYSNPEIRLSKLLINNKDQQFGDGLSIIRQPLNRLEQLTLKYTQNSISMDIMANQFTNPDKIKYRFKLSGYNADWVNNESDRRVKFDKLRTGNYTLFLNASNTNGAWSSNVRELQIRVLPPPWLSWWAYTVYVLIGFTLVFFYWKNYRNRLIRKQEEEFNKREASRLKEVDDMKTRFFSNITHEFRTPLTLILSPLEKQLRDKKYPLEVQSILESNYRHGSHLLKLVNELLDISKLEGGFMQMHKSTGQLNPFLKGCVENFSDLAQQKRIDLSFESKSINGYHQFDKNHLEKVVQNLLSNALKFTDQGGKVGLRAEVTEDENLFLEVHDSGIGIPNEQLPKLFDRFYQVDDTATRAYEGTGIGLSLVKELIDLMEGNIAVESTVGEGTIFKLSIPVSKAIVVSERTTDKKVVESELPEDAPVILVVEDNAELRSFIVESLSKIADVIEAEDGKEGWQMILGRLPDIVVSDVMMPEMNGYELCHKSKTDVRTSHIDFILLTAKTAQESKEKGLESGADDYLTKPFHMYELELRIQNAFQQQANLRTHLRQEFLALKPDEKTPVVKNDFLRKLNEALVLNNKNINVEGLAAEMAMSQSTLNRKLKALLGLSAIEFIKQARLQRAVELLLTDQNMSDIAYQVGFESPSYFSQCFKEAYGMSPSDYQKTAI